MTEPLPAALPTSELVKQLASQSVELVEKEIELAKSELSREARAEEGVAERAGVTVVFALIGLEALVLAAIFGLARVVPNWAAALIVAGVAIVSSVAFALASGRRAKTTLPRTRRIFAGELAWLKKQLR